MIFLQATLSSVELVKQAWSWYQIGNLLKFTLKIQTKNEYNQLAVSPKQLKFPHSKYWSLKIARQSNLASIENQVLELYLK